MGQTETVKAWLRQGVDVNARSQEGRTARMFAVINTHADTVQTLLQFGGGRECSIGSWLYGPYPCGM